MDTLARSLKDLVYIIEELDRREISFVASNENIATLSASGKLIFHTFGV